MTDLLTAEAKELGDDPEIGAILDEVCRVTRMGFAADGMPTAVQIVGRPGDEATLFSLAAQIEAERPWADLRPPIS